MKHYVNLYTENKKEIDNVVAKETVAYLEAPLEPNEVDVIEFNGVRYEKQPLVKD